MPGLVCARKKAGKGLTYTRVDGSRLSENDVLKRIKALVIPPAWTDVWICPSQTTTFRRPGATRRTASSTGIAGKHEVRAPTLPAIREKVQERLALRGLPRKKVLAPSSTF
jgi:DNA topoisomerase-1